MSLAAIARPFEMGGYQQGWISSLLHNHQQVRYRNRVNLKNPLPMHYKRKRIMVVTTPILPPQPQVCQNVLNPQMNQSSILENPYALFLAGQLRRDFSNHPMVAIFHYVSYSQADFMKVRIMLHDSNFPMKIQERLNTKVAEASLKNTRWAAVLPLCLSKTALGFCSSTDVPKLLRVLKKMPMFILLGLVYENRLLHREDVDRVAKMGNILGLHAQLASTLSRPTMALSQSLTAGQAALVNNLSAYAKELGEGSSSSSESSTSDDDDDSSSSSSDDSDNESEKK